MLTVIAGTLLIAVMFSGRAVLAQADAPTARGLSNGPGRSLVIVGWGSVRGDGELTITTVKDAGGLMRTDPTLQVRVSQLPERPACRDARRDARTSSASGHHRDQGGRRVGSDRDEGGVAGAAEDTGLPEGVIGG